MQKKNIETILYSSAGVVLMLLILVACNLIAGVAKQRVDLTAEKLYTLSPGTRAILSRLDTPIKIRFYCTRGDQSMPMVLKTYAQRVEDLLSEYRQASRGLIEIEKLDPQPDSDAEDSANLDGVEGQLISMTDKIYLGLSITCLDHKEKIPFLAPEREKLLEYDLSRAIANLAHPDKPVLGVMSALPIFGQQMNPMMMQMGGGGAQEPWAFLSELKRDFEVRQIEMNSEKIPEDIKVLMVLYPRDITDVTQYAIDQFVLRGGRLVAFLDPLSFAETRGSPMGGMRGGGASLDKLVKAWGLEFDPGKVVVDMTFVTQLNRGGVAEPAPAVLSMTEEGVNTDDALTGQVDRLLLAYTGVFTGTPVAGLKQTVLLKSSKDSQLIEKMMAQMPGDQLVNNFVRSDKEYTLALRLSGKFKTAFPDGKPADPAADKTKPAAPAPSEPALKESASETSVILVGDSDLLYDPVCVQVQNFFGQKVVQPTNGNLGLAQSMVEQLSGDSNLIGVRSRATLNRPFTVVRGMQAQAEERFRNKIKEIEDELASTRQRLGELQKNKDQGQRFVLSAEQQVELQKFRQKESDAKRELKMLRKNLRRDIDSLQTRLQWVNIAGMPLLVTFTGIGLAMLKRRKTAAV